MPVPAAVWTLLLRKRLGAIDFFRKHPHTVQDTCLKTLLIQGAATEWGREHGFRDIRNEAAFQDRVPISRYEDIRPLIDRMRHGEPSVLWPGQIHWFAKSSGTTGQKSKFIPVSNTTLNNTQYRGIRDALCFYLSQHPETRLFNGKALTLGGSHQIDSFGGHTRSGDLSAIMIQNAPRWASLFRTPDRKVALLPVWEEKLEQITRQTLRQNISSISGVPSWNLVLLKHILQVTGKESITDVWPSLELFIHGGISFTPYRTQFQTLIPSGNMHYLETYNASEGFFAIQDDLTRDDMLLMLDYQIYFEFLPLEKLDDSGARAVSIEGVETGKNYALIISTSSGLWRYLIGDTVMFTSLFPHRIRITGRTAQYINAFGEELMVDNAEKALAEACLKTGARIRDYTAGPVYMDRSRNGAHEWLIEFEESPDNLAIFVQELDRHLCMLNSDYEAKRNQNITLGPPLVRTLPQGTFYQWMKQKGKLGGQNKVPRLSNHREYIESVMEITESIHP